jgi:hypothetical protein
MNLYLIIKRNKRGEINRPFKRLFIFGRQLLRYPQVPLTRQPFSELQRLVLKSLDSQQPLLLN